MFDTPPKRRRARMGFVKEGVGYIPLTRGLYSKCDPADVPFLDQYTWNAGGYEGAFYAITSLWDSKNSRQYNVHLHRLLLKPQDKQNVDHINCDRLDNRRSNLRLCTFAENQRNRRKYRGTSQFKGVTWHKQQSKWQASISINNRFRYLGRFDDEVEAAKCYDKHALLHYGAFARVNFPLAS